METKPREAIEAHVRGTPGASARGAARAAGVDDSTADYHLRRLQKEGLLRSHGRGRSVTWWHAACGAYCPVLLEAIPVFRKDAAVAVARALDAFPATAGEVARRAGVPLGQARWYARVLEEMGLAEKTQTGRVALAEGAATCVAMAAKGERCALWGRCAPSRAARPALAVIRTR